VRYWEANHAVCDQQGRIDMPIGFELIGINRYTFDGSPSAARMALRDMGMREDSDFAAVCV
jgi:hypothetical protein